MAAAPSRYELLERIAVGGMAEVYRAKAFGAHGFEKTLAIKKILPDLASDTEFEDRFIAEAKLAVGLSHANVVQVLDFGRFAGTLFIAMELVQGVDLAALLKFFSEQGKKLPIPAAFQIAIELSRGLAFAHQNGVVHRDVSPSNILLSQAGEVKIADFGIATAMREDAERDQGRIMGKWRYMSPEQTRGKILSERSDIFSAATVIYEVFSGSQLFPGESSQEIIDNIHCMELPRLSEVRAGVPPELDEILLRALRRDVEERSIGGDELIRSLTEASYRSSLVATSVDVAEAVQEAIEAGVGSSVARPAPKAGGGLDAIVRAQLAQGKQSEAVPRKTSVDLAHAETEIVEAPMGERATMIPSGVDGRGVTIWRLDAETVAAGPAALRKEGELPSLDEGTEADFSGLRRGILYSLIGFSSLIALMVWLVGRSPNRLAESEGAIADAGRSGTPAVLSPRSAKTEFLHLTSQPPGAEVFIDGKRLPELSPVDTQVQPERDYEVRFELAGHESYQQIVRLQRGQPLNLAPVLRPKRATLSVQTNPAGAQVYLDGKLLGTTGETPLLNDQLQPSEASDLEIRLAGHATVRRTVRLGDSPLSIRETLKSNVVYGEVNISVVSKELGPDGVPVSTWGEVFVDDKKQAKQAPNVFRLPVGKRKVFVTNPASGKSTRKTIEVMAEERKTYIFQL